MSFRERKRGAANLNLSSAEGEIRRQKQATLEKDPAAGDAEFSFMVGADAGTAEVSLASFLCMLKKEIHFVFILQLMHCSKFDLLVASDYFEGLLRKLQPGQPPVLIRHVQPHIFKMMLR